MGKEEDEGALMIKRLYTSGDGSILIIRDQSSLSLSLDGLQ
jgi:hypothetical protein